MLDLGFAQLDLEKQVLTVGTRTVVLQRKPYLVLLYLIENRQRMVLRKELLDHFWDGKEVYDQSLSKAVATIRKALGDEASASMIETRWGLGYRYIGPFSTDAPAIVPSSSVAAAATEALNGAPGPILERDQTVDPTNEGPALRPTPAVRPHLAIAISAVLLLLFVVFAAFAFHRYRSSQKQQAFPLPFHTVAVLPFTVTTQEDDDRYLGAELADAIAVRLETEPQLTVRSSSTVRSMVDPTVDLDSAAHKLKVQAVVRGEIRHVTNRLFMTVTLLDGNSGAELWSGTFNTEIANIFTTEDAIAQQVSRALLPELGTRGLKRSSNPDTTSQAAYALFTKARFFATTRTRTSLAKAINLLNQAIAIDPNYARAYATLADCYQLQGFYQFEAPADSYPRAKVAALKALSLDNSLVEAHVALLSIFTDYDWDWEGAEREFKATTALDPNYAVAYQYYGYGLFGMGRGNDALVAMQHAAQLDPVSPSIQTSLAWAYYLLRQNQQAVDQCKRALELYPDFVPAHQLLGIVYGQMNVEQTSMAELNQAEELEKDGAITPILIDYELARSGHRGEAERMLKTLQPKLSDSSFPYYYLAAAWLAAGDKDNAQASLNRALAARSNWVIYLHYDPRFDDLRSGSKFQGILQKVDGEASAAHSDR